MYVHDIEVLGAAGKVVRRAGNPKPIGTARDLWVGLDASERCIRAYSGVRMRNGSAGCGEEGSEEGGTIRPNALDRCHV